MPDRICSIDGCDAPAARRGWCHMHYGRWYRHGSPTAVVHARRRRADPPKACSVEGCDLTSETRGYCRMHYARWLSTGNPGSAEPLRKRREERGYVSQYAADGKSRVQQHRAVMEAILGRPLRPFETVHHKNGVRHDNRPENLELWTRPQPAGQRPEDLARWVVEQYPDLVNHALSAASTLRLVV